METVAPTGRDRPGTAAGARPKNVFADLDLGTNNCRLLVARPTFDGFRVIDAFSRIVRLGEGVSATGTLSDAAMERTLQALRICAAKMRRRGVRRWRAVATEACRRAGNFEAFRARVREQTGLDLEVISSREEARLSMTGCAPLLDPTVRQALVFDIGGGSTELVWLSTNGLRPEVIDVISLPLGVVNLAELHGGDRVSPDIYEKMIDDVADALEDFDTRHGIRRAIELGDVQMLGSSGTVTTLAGVFKDLPRYDRSAVDGTFLDFEQAISVSRSLLAMDFAARAAHPCIGRERADLVVAGCAVLEAICRVWPVGRLRIADRGVREGILTELMGVPDRRRTHSHRPADTLVV